MLIELEVGDDFAVKVNRVADCEGTDFEMMFAAAIRRAAVGAVRELAGASVTPVGFVEDLVSEGRSFPR